MSYQVNILVLLFGILQSWLVSVALLRKKERHPSQVYLVMFILVVGLQLTFKATSKDWLWEHSRTIYMVSYNFGYLIGPLIYFYFRARRSPTRFQIIDILHVVPFVLSTIQTLLDEIFGIIIPSLVPWPSLQLLSLIIYGLVSWNLSNSEPKDARPTLKQFLVSTLVVETVIIVTIAIMVRNNDTFPDVRALFVALTALIYWITYKLISSPSAFSVAGNASEIKPQSANAAKYANSGLTKDESLRIMTQLRHTIDVDKIFAQHDITLDDVSSMVPTGPFRVDLPVLFVVAGLDIRQDNYVRLWEEVLKNRSPWTITLASEMPHAFDAFSDTDGSKRLIMTTISYWLNQLGKVPPSPTPPSAERAIVAARYEDTEKMLQLMREWIAQHPDTRDAFALSAYANALVDTKNFAEAEKYLKKSIDVNPSNKGNYLNMAVVCYALGKPKEASANLLLYEKNSTPEGFTYAYIANRLIEINQFKEAAENYERAISFPNPHSFIYYNLGCCYAMLGEKDRAFENLNKAVDLTFGDKSGYEVDEKLKNLHGDARWTELLAKLK